MAIQETIKTGRKYRKCIDNTPGNKKWERYSFWTKSTDVEFSDGTTVESKLGSYKGVTANENQAAGYAADITLVKSIKTSLTNLITSLTNLVNSINDRLGEMRFYEDSTGKYVIGADSVPKKLGSVVEGLTSNGTIIGGHSLYLAPSGVRITTSELVWDTAALAAQALDTGDYLVIMTHLIPNATCKMGIIKENEYVDYPSILINYANNITSRAYIIHVDTPTKLFAKYEIIGNIPEYGTAFASHMTIKLDN